MGEPTNKSVVYSSRGRLDEIKQAHSVSRSLLKIDTVTTTTRDKHRSRKVRDLTGSRCNEFRSLWSGSVYQICGGGLRRASGT